MAEKTLRELMLAELEFLVNDGDEELVEEFGSYDDMVSMSDLELFNAYTFAVSFRG